MAKGHRNDEGEELCYEQDSHVSKAILNGVEPNAYRCINTNLDKKIWLLTDKQKDIVREVGLSHISEIDYMRIDHVLLTRLVERWRPEAKTFHLPTGKATVTLEDVTCIYGLPIDGPPVTGRTFPLANISEVCIELLGMAPRPGKDSMVSGQLFSNSSGARGPAWQLELFKEFKSYARGPACLASLYMMLTRVTTLLKGEEEEEEVEGGEKGSSANITKLKTLIGPLQLLQIWAYSRMAIGRCPKPDHSWKKDLQFPLFKTWEMRLLESKKVTNMKEIWMQINNLPEDGFDWQPYAKMSKKLFEQVPKHDKELFSSLSVLLHYWVVERHCSERVSKQFGIKQDVSLPFYLPFTRVDRLERCEMDYSQYDEEVMRLWDKRRETILRGIKA